MWLLLDTWMNITIFLLKKQNIVTTVKDTGTFMGTNQKMFYPQKTEMFSKTYSFQNRKPFMSFYWVYLGFIGRTTVMIKPSDDGFRKKVGKDIGHVNRREILHRSCKNISLTLKISLISVEIRNTKACLHWKQLESFKNTY